MIILYPVGSGFCLNSIIFPINTQSIPRTCQPRTEVDVFSIHHSPEEPHKVGTIELLAEIEGDQKLLLKEGDDKMRLL